MGNPGQTSGARRQGRSRRLPNGLRGGVLAAVVGLGCLGVTGISNAAAATTNPLAFAPPLTYPTGVQGTVRGAAVAAFNGGGKPAVATADVSGGNVVVVSDAGNTTRSFPVGSSPGAPAATDLNGDNLPDLVVANSGAHTISVLLNEPGSPGTFADAVDYTVGNAPIAVTLADLNGDHHPDIVVTNNQSGSVSVLLNNAGTPGTFADATSFSVGTSPNGVVVDDFDGDGHPDIATANFGTSSVDSSTVSILYGDGSGGFATQQTFAAGDRPYQLAVGKFDADGHPDLAVSDWPTVLGSGTDQVQVLLNNGQSGAGAGFDAPTQVAALPNQFFPGIPVLAVGDLSGDGHSDIAVADGTNTYIYAGDGSGGFASGVGAGTGPLDGLAIADVNGDGALDLAAADNTIPGNIVVALHELPPANRSRPVFEDRALVNQYAQVSAGNWKSLVSPNYDYQVQRCDAAGSNCADIPGEAGSGVIFVLTSSDDIGHRLRVGVTASNDAGSAGPVYSAPSNVVPQPPANLQPPAISGEVTVGHSIAAGGDRWGRSVSRSYRWWLCPAGDTDPTDPGSNCYYPFAFDRSALVPTGFAGAKIEVEEIVSSSTYGTSYATSDLVTVIGITPTSLPILTVGQAESSSLTAAGGTAPYTWTVSSGALPSGVSLASDGTLSGAPTAAGSFAFTVQARDSGSPDRIATQKLRLKVLMAIGPASLPKGKAGHEYTAALTADGGTGPYQWSMTAGSLPGGLTLSPDGTITGTPDTTGTYKFTVTVTDSSNPALTASKSKTVYVTS
jgi:hypothetical protein